MADPLEQLSDADLQALSKNDLDSMSDTGLKIVAASGPAKPAPPPSAAASGARAALSGFAGNFDDEASGAISAAGRTVGVKNLGTWKPFNPDSHLETDAPTLDPSKLMESYRQNRDAARKEQHADEQAHPVISTVANAAGMVANPGMRALGAAGMGATQGLGGSEADLTKGEAGGALADTGKGALYAYLGGKMAEGAGKLAPKLGEFAEQQAVKASGATGLEASKFAPGTGRMLLDEGHVGLGMSQPDVANSLSKGLKAQGSIIGQTIDDLTAQGASGNRADLVAGIQAKIDEIGADPAQAQVVKQLESIKESVAAGPETPSLRQIEDSKKGFQKLSNYNDPDSSAAKKAAADVYRQSAEGIATGADSEAAQKFTDAKSMYGQISPVAKAAARRASTTAQSPYGGFMDVGAAGAGMVAGGPTGALVAPVARRLLSPYAATTMASTANSLSQILQKSPQTFGKFAPALTAAAARGETSLAASAYVLQQRDPEFRQKMQELNNGGPLSDADE